MIILPDMGAIWQALEATDLTAVSHQDGRAETGFVLELDVECIITLAGQNTLSAKCQGILVELRDGQLYKCKMCQRFTKDAIIRYKVVVMAYDCPASITLLLWDD
ncbi:hypothetical protein PIB30_037534 [Stylosanthes scabra]|uniref:Replication factor A C-terminal domain-containing protein n=1 Tax=Stylosanthes scabra TaxID=79078 RepID=A0ABU6RDV2_9FABA|nr:hypothetical protein [Stylosanthes scabra]